MIYLSWVDTHGRTHYGVDDIWSFLKSVIVRVVSLMDNFYIFSTFSLLDFFISLLVFGVILTLFINVVSVRSHDLSVSVRDRSRARKSKNSSTTESEG